MKQDLWDELLECEKVLFLLQNQEDKGEPDYCLLSDIFEKIKREFYFSSITFWMYKAFQYGMMIGKRTERAKKVK